MSEPQPIVVPPHVRHVAKKTIELLESGHSADAVIDKMVSKLRVSGREESSDG